MRSNVSVLAKLAGVIEAGCVMFTQIKPITIGTINGLRLGLLGGM